MPRVWEQDGFGRYGVLEETTDGLVCADCGWVGSHLGLHAFRAHGLDADAYRARHGLLRGGGLVVSNTRQKIRANGRAGLASRAKFVAGRDPALATSVRLSARRPTSPEEEASRNARMGLIGKKARIATVLTCEWGGVQFCPLGDKRRRFCSRSCSARHNRSARR